MSETPQQFERRIRETLTDDEKEKMKLYIPCEKCGKEVWTRFYSFEVSSNAMKKEGGAGITTCDHCGHKFEWTGDQIIKKEGLIWKVFHQEPITEKTE